MRGWWILHFHVNISLEKLREETAGGDCGSREQK